MPIFASRERILDGRMAPVQNPFTEWCFRSFRKRQVNIHSVPVTDWFPSYFRLTRVLNLVDLQLQTLAQGESAVLKISGLLPWLLQLQCYTTFLCTIVGQWIHYLQYLGTYSCTCVLHCSILVLNLVCTYVLNLVHYGRMSPLPLELYHGWGFYNTTTVV